MLSFSCWLSVGSENRGIERVSVRGETWRCFLVSDVLKMRGVSQGKYKKGWDFIQIYQKSFFHCFEERSFWNRTFSQLFEKIEMIFECYNLCIYYICTCILLVYMMIVAWECYVSLMVKHDCLAYKKAWLFVLLESMLFRCEKSCLLISSIYKCYNAWLK